MMDLKFLRRKIDAQGDEERRLWEAAWVAAPISWDTYRERMSFAYGNELPRWEELIDAHREEWVGVCRAVLEAAGY